MKNLVFLIATALLLVQCSKNSAEDLANRAAGLPPLSEEQKTTLITVLSGSGNILNAASKNRRAALGLDLFDADVIHEELQEKISQAYTAGNCEINVSNRKHPSQNPGGPIILIQSPEKNFSLSISGPTCPASATLIAQVIGTPNALQGKLSAHFRATNDVLIGLNGIRSFDFEAEGNLNAQGDVTKAEYEGEISGGGSIVSEAYGKMSIALQGHGQATKTAQNKTTGTWIAATQFTLGSFTAILVEKATFQNSDFGTYECYLNSEKISHYDYMQYIKATGGDIHSWSIFRQRPQ